MAIGKCECAGECMLKVIETHAPLYGTYLMLCKKGEEDSNEEVQAEEEAPK